MLVYCSYLEDMNISSGVPGHCDDPSQNFVLTVLFPIT
jgi:hypothetical protein